MSDKVMYLLVGLGLVAVIAIWVIATLIGTGAL